MNLRLSIIIIWICLLNFAFLIQSCHQSDDLPLSVSFNLNGAVALIAQDDAVVDVSSVVKKQESSSTLNHRNTGQHFSSESGNTLEQGVIDPPIENSLSGAVSFATSGSSTVTSRSNLFSISSDGSAKLTIESDYFVKVKYSVVDPLGQYVYLALDAGLDDSGEPYDSNDYTSFIAASNCAFFKVKLSDNSYSCVKENIVLQSIDGVWSQYISGSQKPVQFDDDGSVFFAGQEFTVIRQSWATEISYFFSPSIIYRVAADGTEIQITQDNVHSNSFIALKTGEIVYLTTNQVTGMSGLSMWRNGSTVTLSDGTWGVYYFTVDDSNTVIWGDPHWDSRGLFTARPRLQGGVEKTSLDISLFNLAQTYNIQPVRVIVADDGNLYGVFEAYDYTYFVEDLPISYIKNLMLFKVLPYDGTPIVKLEIDPNENWRTLLSKAKFEIANGFIFFAESVDVPFLGSRDVIKMVNIEQRTTESLLADVDDRYEIYHWRLSGDMLYFAGHDQNTTTVVLGKVDTAAVAAGEAEEDYLTIQEYVSASGATSTIKDMEILSVEAEIDNGLNPSADIILNSENVNSATIKFSKRMDRDSVVSGLTFSDGTDDIPAMKIWIQNSLHMIPDNRGLNGLDGTAMTEPLDYDATYHLFLDNSVTDDWGRFLGDEISASFTTRPVSGFYIGNSNSSNANISSGQALKFASAIDYRYVDAQTFVVGSFNDASSDGISVEFSGKNLGYQGVAFVLFSPDETYTERVRANVLVSNWASLCYKSSLNSGDNEYTYSDTATPLMNGSFKRYRLEFINNGIKLLYTIDGSNFIEFDELTVSDDLVLGSPASGDFELLMRVDGDIIFDDYVVRIFNGTSDLGVLNGPYNFDDGLLPEIFSTDVNPSRGFSSNLRSVF